MTEPSDDVLTLVLRDGRTVSYALAGADDGPLVVHHHGTGASRIEGELFADLGVRHGFRLLTMDRPSYGLSTPFSDRTLEDWTRDVADVADSLGIEAFAVSGLSGGGPHALAVASFLPDRVTHAVIINSGVPTEDAEVLEASARRDRRVWEMARTNPDRFTRTVSRMMSREPGRVSQLLLAVLLPKLDRQLLKDPATRETLDRSGAEGRRQPGRRFDEALLIWGRDWGFDPYKVEPPMTVFSGQEDQGRAFARKLADRAPNATLDEFPGGHLAFLQPDVMERIGAAMRG